MQDLERINRELEQEIGVRKLAEQRAHELSTHDALTGLVNRRSLIQQLEHAVASADRSGSDFALLFLDLDKFKPVNDHYGHEAGDELLRQVSARLTAAVRASDVVARLGGDEFVVLIEGKSAAANAARVARKIEQANARPYIIGKERIKIASSIGIALYPQDGADAQALMKHADMAMYHAKHDARHDASARIKFFHEELNVRETERQRWSQELRDALLERQLELRYQPQVSLRDGQVEGAEALLYWRHPRLGLIAAPQFLPHVQDRALLDQLDYWVIAGVCAQAAAWRDAAIASHQLHHFRIALNLATPQLHADVTRRLLAELRKHRLPPGSIELELNERLLFDSSGDIDTLLHQLQQAGASIALDEFGSAHSSLAACKRLRLDALKIDRGFVAAIGNAHGGDNIVAAIIHLARAMSMQVVALGVTGMAQLDALRTLGCDRYQGELFCAPKPAQELLQHLYHTVSAIGTQAAQRSILTNEDFVDE